MAYKNMAKNKAHNKAIKQEGRTKKKRIKKSKRIDLLMEAFQPQA